MRKRSGRPPRFAAVPNSTIDDVTRLDFMALALLTVLLRHRDGWEITLARIGARYGYGEDAMAGAMGLLQVARYVVKLRVMSAGGHWSTEVAVYETPATDDDVAELLADIRREQPAARRVEVIPPTKTAYAKADKRRAKLGAPRLGEFPDSVPTCGNAEKPQVAPESGVPRDPGDPGVSKKTTGKNTRQEDETAHPSVPTPEVVARGRASTNGRMDGDGSALVEEELPAAGGQPAAAGAAPANHAATGAGAGSGRRSPVRAAPITGPGADVLRAIMAELPQWTLDADALRDQAAAVDGMLAAGFTPAEIRNAFACRPLPVPLTHTVGAVAARRLRDLMQIGPGAGVPRIPQQGAGRQHTHPADRDLPTPTPPPLEEQLAAIEDAALDGGGPVRFCPEDDRTCPRVVAPGEDRCAVHLGWPLCSVCGGRPFGSRRMRPGATACDRCTSGGAVGPFDAELAGLLTQAAQSAREDDAGSAGGTSGRGGSAPRPVRGLK